MSNRTLKPETIAALNADMLEGVTIHEAPKGMVFMPADTAKQMDKLAKALRKALPIIKGDMGGAAHVSFQTRLKVEAEIKALLAKHEARFPDVLESDDDDNENEDSA